MTNKDEDMDRELKGRFGRESESILKEINRKEEIPHEDEIIDVVKTLVGGYVYHPDELGVTVSLANQRYQKYMIYVVSQPRDFGKVAGSAGRNIRALRAVVDALGAKLGMNLGVIQEQRAGQRVDIPPYTHPIYRDNWDKKELLPVIKKTFAAVGMEHLTVLILKSNSETSLFTVANYRDEREQEFAMAFAWLLVGIGKNQGHRLIQDDTLSERKSV